MKCVILVVFSVPHARHQLEEQLVLVAAPGAGP
jgi:hypothetical protein